MATQLAKRTVALTDEQHWEIIRLHGLGFSVSEIMAVTGLHNETITARIRDGIPVPGANQVMHCDRYGVARRCDSCGGRVTTERCVVCDLRKYQELTGGR